MGHKNQNIYLFFGHLTKLNLIKFYFNTFFSQVKMYNYETVPTLTKMYKYIKIIGSAKEVMLQSNVIQ